MFFLKILRHTVPVLLLFLLLPECHAKKAAADPGKKTLRIVSLSPAVTELLYLLGSGNSLIGRSSACDYPENCKKLPVMGDFARPAVEKILKNKPDIVITNDLIVPAAANTLRQYKIKVLFFPCRSIEEYREMVRKLGSELDAEKQAASELRRLDAFLNRCRKWKKLNKKLLCLVWHHPVIATGDLTFLSELIHLAGAENCVRSRIRGYFKPSAKFLLNCDADALLVFSDPARYRKHPVLKHLKAVKKQQIVYFPFEDQLQRPGPRFTDGVLKLREYLEK